MPITTTSQEDGKHHFAMARRREGPDPASSPTAPTPHGTGSASSSGGHGRGSVNAARRTGLAVIPAYNEEQALQNSVRTMLTVCPDIDALIVNDGSSDSTEEIARNLATEDPRVHVVTLPFNCGIGAAVQTGLLFAQRHGYPAAVQYDADGQHDAAGVAALLQVLQQHGADLCIGSRFLGDTDKNFQSTRLRRIGIRFFTHLIGVLCGVRCTDPTSGFRAFGRRAIEFFARCYPDDYPEPEVVLLAARSGLRIVETPVRMHPRQGGASSIGCLHSVYYMTKVTVAILIDRIRAKDKTRNDR